MEISSNFYGLLRKPKFVNDLHKNLKKSKVHT